MLISIHAAWHKLSGWRATHLYSTTRGRHLILLSLWHSFLSGFSDPLPTMFTLAAVEKEGVLSRVSLSRPTVAEGREGKRLFPPTRKPSGSCLRYWNRTRAESIGAAKWRLTEPSSASKQHRGKWDDCRTGDTVYDLKAETLKGRWPTGSAMTS